MEQLHQSSLLTTLLPWVQAELNSQSTLLFQDWTHRNGTALSLGHKRLILVPSLSIDMKEIKISEQWVDDAIHTGDYYLAIQVDPDKFWLRIWGYITHRQLKAIAEHRPRDRCYLLETEHLIPDINVFGVVQQLCPDETTRFVAESSI